HMHAFHWDLGIHVDEEPSSSLGPDQVGPSVREVLDLGRQVIPRADHDRGRNPQGVSRLDERCLPCPFSGESCHDARVDRPQPEVIGSSGRMSPESRRQLLSPALGESPPPGEPRAGKGRGSAPDASCSAKVGVAVAAVATLTELDPGRAWIIVTLAREVGPAGQVPKLGFLTRVKDLQTPELDRCRSRGVRPLELLWVHPHDHALSFEPPPEVAVSHVAESEEAVAANDDAHRLVPAGDEGASSISTSSQMACHATRCNSWMRGVASAGAQKHTSL